MATSKLLKPTNVTISIPEFTDQPDQRVNSNCIDKEADAINTLSEQIEQYSKEYKLDLVGNAPVSIKNNTTTQIIQTGSLDEAYDAIRITFSWNGLSDSKTFETNKTKDTTRGFYTFLGVLFTENNNPTHAYIAVNFSLNGRYMAVKYLETTRDLSTWTAYTGNGITVTEIIGIIRGVQ